MERCQFIFVIVLRSASCDVFGLGLYPNASFLGAGVEGGGVAARPIGRLAPSMLQCMQLRVYVKPPVISSVNNSSWGAQSCHACDPVRSNELVWEK